MSSPLKVQMLLSSAEPAAIQLLWFSGRGRIEKRSPCSCQLERSTWVSGQFHLFSFPNICVIKCTPLHTSPLFLSLVIVTTSLSPSSSSSPSSSLSLDKCARVVSTWLLCDDAPVISFSPWLLHVSFDTVVNTSGEELNIYRITRLHMGPYICLASNGILPSVSKRVLLKVQCKCLFNCQLLVCLINFTAGDSVSGQRARSASSENQANATQVKSM